MLVKNKGKEEGSFSIPRGSRRSTLRRARRTLRREGMRFHILPGEMKEVTVRAFCESSFQIASYDAMRPTIFRLANMELDSRR